MDEEVRLSRLRISRRRAMSVGGSVGLAGLLSTYGAGAAQAAPPTPAELIALLDKAQTCRLTPEATAGPYWFDVESLRTDIRESRPGTQLNLAFRVQDITGCAPGAGKTVPNAVVEIWHCDAGGLYSGYEAASRGANGGGGGGGGGFPGGPGGFPGGPGGPGGFPGGPGGFPGGPGGPGGFPGGPGGPGGFPGGPGGPGGFPGGPGGFPGGPGGNPGGGGTGKGDGISNGPYSSGEQESRTTDDGTYLRGAQVANSDGIVQFTTIYPGWYTGRTAHIHAKVHINKRSVLTTQMYFDDTLTDQIYRAAPYSSHPGRDTRNNRDSYYNSTGLVSTQSRDGAYLGVLNLAIDN